MKGMVWDTIKVFVIFFACTIVFYFGLQYMNSEYEQMHQYDAPEGPSVKVFNMQHDFFDRLNLFFQLGE